MYIEGLQVMVAAGERGGGGGGGRVQVDEWEGGRAGGRTGGLLVKIRTSEMPGYLFWCNIFFCHVRNVRESALLAAEIHRGAVDNSQAQEGQLALLYP